MLRKLIGAIVGRKASAGVELELLDQAPASWPFLRYPVAKPPASEMLSRLPRGLPEDYLAFIAATGGGYSGDHIYHFFGLSGPPPHDVIWWNDPRQWKRFAGLRETDFCFAEDVLGNQYHFRLGDESGEVWLWNPDEACSARFITSFDLFVRRIVIESPEDPDPIAEQAREYYAAHRAKWKPFTHISWVRPLILGGAVDPSNMHQMNSLANLQISAQIVVQARALPEGAVVKEIEVKPDRRVRLIV